MYYIHITCTSCAQYYVQRVLTDLCATPILWQCSTPSMSCRNSARARSSEMPPWPALCLQSAIKVFFCCVIVSSCVLQLIKLHPCTYINDIHVHAYMYIMLCLGQTRTVNVRMHERVFDCNSMWLRIVYSITYLTMKSMRSPSGQSSVTM